MAGEGEGWCEGPNRPWLVVVVVVVLEQPDRPEPHVLSLAVASETCCAAFSGYDANDVRLSSEKS